MKTVYFLLLFIAFSLDVSAQSLMLRGRIIDSRGEAVPFASIYKGNTTIGTSANNEGEYQLRLNEGKHTILFKAIGFKPETKQVDLKGNQNLDVILETSVYQLNDIVVKEGAEDPAYEVIRNAIRKRKSYLNEVGQYTADVYIKGMQKLLDAPKKFLGRDIDEIGREAGLDSNRRGIIYLSESESRLSYMQPGQYREEMISSKVAGSNRAFSFNRASNVISLYNNIIDFEGLSNRPFISPVADNALFYYSYKLLGTSVENGELVNKIMIIPKRNADPVFRGLIYILEDSWRIHSTDVLISKEANINIIDTLKISQQYIPVSSKIWMPSSTRFDFKGGILGFRFGGYFLNLYKNYDLNPKLNKKDFEEVLKITRDVNQKDSTYWQQSRPVPLTAEETADYAKKEVLAAKRESKTYLDSLDKARNKFKVLPFIIGPGYTLRNRYQGESFHFSPLINSVFYNTIEGFGFNYQVSYTKQIDSLTNKLVSVSGKLRYGFSSEKLYGSLKGGLPAGASKLEFGLGSDVLDLNDQGTISLLGNSINSLFYERNFLKLYEKRFVNTSISNRFGGISTRFSAEWAHRASLQNTTDYTIRDLENRSFTSNNPFSPVSDVPLFERNQAFKLSVRAEYAFSNKYSTYPSGRFYEPSKYPLLGISYTKGFKGIFGSDVDYDLIAADLTKKDVKLGMYGVFKVGLGAGKFLNKSQLYYVDYKHFTGNQSLTYIPRINHFLFLDLYNFSTPDQYVEVHLEHNFSGFFLNKLPLIRKLKLQEIAGFNYLTTPNIKNYTEVYFGLQYLSFRGMYGMSYSGGKRIDQGFRIAYGF